MASGGWNSHMHQRIEINPTKTQGFVPSVKTLKIKWFVAFQTIPSNMEDKSLPMRIKAQCWVLGWFIIWKQHMFHLGILSDSFTGWLRRPGMRESSATNSDWYKQHSHSDKQPSISHHAGVSAVNKDAVKIFLTSPNRRVTVQTSRFLEKEYAISKEQLRAGNECRIPRTQPSIVS